MNSRCLLQVYLQSMLPSRSKICSSARSSSMHTFALLERICLHEMPSWGFLDTMPDIIAITAWSAQSSATRWDTSNYCPLAPPRDSPPNPDWRTYDPLQLPLRDHTTSRQWTEHVSRTGDNVTTRRTGIAKRTKSIIFPWSYGLDALHLFYLNVVPRMRDYWAGQYSFAKVGVMPVVRMTRTQTRILM